jgi:hypothetical protein
VAKHADLSNTHQQPLPLHNAELLLMSRMDYIMTILLCPLVLVVNIDDALSTEMCLICKKKPLMVQRNVKHFIEQNADKSSLVLENQQA